MAADVAAADTVIGSLALPSTVAAMHRARGNSENNIEDPVNTKQSTEDLNNAVISDLRKMSISPTNIVSDSIKTKSRLASHARTGSMSLLLQSKSMEKELNTNFGNSAPSSTSPVVATENDDEFQNGLPRAETAPLTGHATNGSNNNDIEKTKSSEDLTQIPSVSNKSHHRSKSMTEGLHRGSDSEIKHHIPLNIATAEKALIIDDEQQTIINDLTTVQIIDEDAEQQEMEAEATKKVISSARSLLSSGKISAQEFEMLLNCDAKYRDQSVRNEAEIADARLEKCFGEAWETRKQRIISNYLSKSNTDKSFNLVNDNITDVNDESPEMDVRCFIVKSNDDLRQEVCCLQLIELCQEIFSDLSRHNATTNLWLKTYRIISTNSSTGIVQVIPDSMSLDALKKTPGFTTLSQHFQKMYGLSSERLYSAQQNFVSSLAAYSLVCYIFQIKDRHNGNILIDRYGHIIHIDFGFLLGIAPGGAFSIESAPFKLTEEMVDVFGGLDSPFFSEFLRAFTSGFLALKANSETIISTLSLMSTQSTFPCFNGKDTNAIIDKLRARFRTDLSVKDTVQHCLDLIIESYANYGTKQYDTFQWLTNGIIP
jgi:hypothetical protein